MPADLDTDGHSSGRATDHSLAHANTDQNAVLGPKPTPLPVQSDTIPGQLRAIPRWVVWRYEPNAKRDKWTKVPHRADGNGPASSTNPDTWTTFADALAAYQAGEWDGIGFVVGDGIAGGDVDDCRDPETGELSEDARYIITTANTYTEASPGAHGLRYFALGALPPKGRKRGSFELYDGGGGRFLTVTGQHVEGTPATLHERTDQLATIHAQYIAPPERPQPARTSPRGTDVRHEDRDVLEAMWRSEKASEVRSLWEGDTSAHKGDHSSADLALASHLAWWTNYDPEQTDRLFRASDLMRPKWDEARGDMTYGERTLARAFEGHQPGDGYQGGKVRGSAAQADNRRSQASDTEAWPEWQPVPDGTPTAPQLDPNLLPTPLRRWAEDIAARASILLDSLLPGLFVALAITVGNRWRIRPKQHDHWTVVPNLWGVLVHPPGQLKTYVLNSVMRPVRQIEADLLARFEEETERHGVRAERLQAETDALSEKLKKAVKAGKHADADEIEADLIEAKRAQKQHNASAPVLIVNDATTEVLLERLRENPRGVGLVRDELHGWYMSLQKQGREGDRAFYLEAHDGDKAYRQDRVKRGVIAADIVTLSILGGIQPSRLEAIRHGALDGEDADGLLQRLQVLVWPDAMPPYRLVDREPDTDLEAHVTTLYEHLYDLDPARFGFEDGAPGITRFDPDAQELFYAWLERLEHRVREPEVQAAPAWASYLGKLRSLMPSLALLLHLVDLVTVEVDDVRVSLSAAQRAAALVEYLEGHAAKLYAPELARDEIAAERVAKRIEAGDIEDGMKLRDLYRREWSGLTRERVEAGIRLLERLGWVRVVKVPHESGKGRPNVVLRLRPDLLEHLDGAS